MSGGGGVSEGLVRGRGVSEGRRGLVRGGGVSEGRRG